MNGVEICYNRIKDVINISELSIKEVEELLQLLDYQFKVAIDKTKIRFDDIG